MIYPVDITPLTLLDYEGEAACILWYTGCNLRCPYCYNVSLVMNKGVNRTDVFKFLEDRKNFLTGVVLSGGEVTLNKDIQLICEKIKKLNLKIKIDTNGSNPEVIKNLLDKKLIDFVAVDNKMPKYKTWTLPGGEVLYDKFIETIKLLNASGVSYEVRTTVHPALLTEDDIIHMINSTYELGYRNKYNLQLFLDVKDTIGHMATPNRNYDVNKLNKESKLEINYRNFLT